MEKEKTAPSQRLIDATRMLAFMNTALMAMTEAYPDGLHISQKEQIGLQNILFHIEEELDAVAAELGGDAGVGTHIKAVA